jgi:hypothetical protein
MPVKVISTYRRPNTDVLWHTIVFGNGNSSEEFRKEANLIELIQRRLVIDIDDLTLRIEVMWKSKEHYDYFMNIGHVKDHFELVHLYNQSVGIIEEPKEFISV